MKRWVKPQEIIKYGRNEIPKKVEEKKMYQFMIDFAIFSIGADISKWIEMFDIARQIINKLVTLEADKWYYSCELAAVAFVIADKSCNDRNIHISSADTILDNKVIYGMEGDVLNGLNFSIPEQGISILEVNEAVSDSSIDTNHHALISLWCKKHRENIISRLLDGREFNDLLSTEPTIDQLSTIDDVSKKPPANAPGEHLKISLPERPDPCSDL